MANEKRKNISLSKSRFCTGRQCLKALYLRVHEPELAPEVDAAQQLIFDQGTEVGIEARKRFPGGLLIEHDHAHSKEALAATTKAVMEGVPAIFEGAFFFHDTLVRVDVLKNNGDGTWDIYEVKSSTDLKDEHIPDVAIQYYVASGAGIKIRRTFVKHVNRECVFPKLENLFVDDECTDQVKDEQTQIPDYINQMLGALKRDSAPKIDIGPQCASPYKCEFKSQCWTHVPSHSVFELNGVWDKTKFDLYRRGLVRIKDIPLEEKVSRAKPQQLEAIRTQAPVIDRSGLRDFIGQLEYPIYFLDFETINPAIPKYVGLHPYSQIPFQFSCHVIERAGAKAEHVEYLASGTGDPRSEFAEKLLAEIGNDGTIIAYNASFEKTRIKELAEQLPPFADALLDLLPRFIDLKDAFSKHYYHPEFHGSFSLKDVLPTMAPEMTYEGMEVMSGGGAQAAYMKICDPDTPAAEQEKHRRALLEYCKQDTWAMVVLLERVTAVANQKGRAS